MRYLAIAIVLVLLCVLVGYCQVVQTGGTEKQFEEKYAAWQLWRKNNPMSSDHTSCMEFKEIVALGPKVVPMLIKKTQSEQTAFSLTTAIGAITKVRIPKEKWPEGRYGGSKSAVSVYQTWWDVDRKQIKATYQELSTKWDKLKASDTTEKSSYGSPALWYDQFVYDQQSGSVLKYPGKVTNLGQVYFSIKDLGIDVLPLIVTDIENKKYDFLPIFVELTQCDMDGVAPRNDLRAKAVLDWWKIHKDEWIIPDA